MLNVFKTFKKQVCPYCFEYFKINETPFRCSAPLKTCAPEIDEVYNDFWGGSAKLGKVIPPKAGIGARLSTAHKCGACKQKTTKRLCPNCHSILPHTIGQQDNLIFAVIGAKETGKSHYLAVLIEQIKKVVGPSHDFLLEPLGDDTIKRYREKFYNPIYLKHQTINVTRSGFDDSSVRQPLVYSLAVLKENWNGDKEIKKAVTLVFYDTAGEDLNDSDTMSVLNKYIYRSDGIILLIDPLQLPFVRSHLPPDTGLPKINSETADIINRTTRLIEAGQGLTVTDKIKTPLAVTFSKFDAVEPLIDEQYQILAHSNHEDGFDQADFEAVNSEMYALLQQWDCRDILNQTQARYRKVGFFGISALGDSPKNGDKIDRVIPKRVEDPLLWLLSVNNVISTGGEDEV